MIKRRAFVKKTAAGALGLGFLDFSELSANEEKISTEETLEYLANCNYRFVTDYLDSLEDEIEKGNFEHAMKITREGFKCFPDSIFILEESAYWNYEYKNYSNATILCKEVLTIRPNNISSLINLGIVTGRNGNWTEAMDLFNKALQIEPNNSKVLGNLGFVYHKLGDNNSAIKLMKKALWEKPVHTKAHIWLEKILEGEYLA